MKYEEAEKMYDDPRVEKLVSEFSARMDEVLGPIKVDDATEQARRSMIIMRVVTKNVIFPALDKLPVELRMIAIRPMCIVLSSLAEMDLRIQLSHR